MEDKLKQRLTGAAILIAIAVLVVPELFRGQARNDTPQTSTQATALPQRSVTIQLQDSPSSSPTPESGGASSGNVGMAVSAEQHPAPEAAAAAEQQNVETAAAAAEAARAQTPSALPAGDEGATPTTQALDETARAETAAKPQSTVKSVAAAKPDTAKPVPSKPSESAPKAAAANSTASAPSNAPGKSGWSVQLGVFSQRENAERLRKQALGKGMTVEISGPDKRGLFRVRSEIQSDRAAAQRWQQRAQGLGFAGALTQQP